MKYEENSWYINIKSDFTQKDGSESYYYNLLNAVDIELDFDYEDVINKEILKEKMKIYLDYADLIYQDRFNEYIEQETSDGYIYTRYVLFDQETDEVIVGDRNNYTDIEQYFIRFFYVSKKYGFGELN